MLAKRMVLRNGWISCSKEPVSGYFCTDVFCKGSQIGFCLVHEKLAMLHVLKALSFPLGPWHAQRQVESRRCSAGLTVKEIESWEDRS